MPNFVDINWLAVLAAALSAFLLGGVWYGPLFKHAWCRENGMDPNCPPNGHPAKIFGIAFLAALVAAAAFAIILRADPPLFIAVHAGFLTGLAYVGMSFGINYAFAGRSFKLWLIDAGYHTLQFTLYGLILGLWH
jgi:hypothetical protein